MAVANITVSFDELFLKMEGAAPEEAKATAVKTFFTGAQFTKPADLVGVTERDLVEGVDGVTWPKNARQKALARKTIEFAQDLDFELRAQRRQALQTVVPPLAGGGAAAGQQQLAQPAPQRSWTANGLTADQEQRLLLLGADPSAVAQAMAMRNGKKKVDIALALKKAGVENLAVGLRPPLKVWQLLEDHTQFSNDESRRTSFLYVDLTKLVPRWMPSESVGSKSTVMAESFGLRGDPSQTTMGAMFSAMKNAYGAPQWFRTPAQWFVTFVTCYAPPAVAAGHLTWEQVMAHVDRMTRQMEEVRADNGTHHVVFLYDIFVRKRIHELAEMDDPELDVTKIFGELNKELWADAQAKIHQVLAEVGLHGSQQVHQPSASGQGGQDGAAQRAMAQATASAEKSARRAEEAARQMEQNRGFEKRKHGALENAELESPVKQPNHKQRKQAAFKALKEAQAAEKGHGQDGGQWRGQATLKPANTWKKQGWKGKRE